MKTQFSSSDNFHAITYNIHYARQILSKPPATVDSVYKVAIKALEKCFCAIELALQVLKLGNKNCISDASVAGEMAYAAAYGAYYNVQINLLDLKEDQKYCKKITIYSK